MNHKWNNNVCEKCGIKREKKEAKILLRTYSALGRDGCFYDKPVYDFRVLWHYGPTRFERPDCVEKK